MKVFISMHPFVFRDLTSWLNSVTSLVSSDELATDVSRAEALLERHQVIKHPSDTVYI